SKNKTDNNKVVYIVSAINDGMSKKRQIMFKYAERLSSGELQPKNNGSDYYVSPYRLCWKGDTYYLIGYSEKHKRIVTFRVDRICDIPLVIKQDIVPEPEDFQVNDYLNDSFRMSGDEASVEIVFSKGFGIMDNIIDRFGDDFSILSEDEDVCHAVINTSINNAFFAWVFGFGGKVKIKGPHDVLYKYIRMVAAEMARL
ncbi:MAG: WYL domain-containing protein, partial [Saccharofermentans sp.]|nr:WYL domain-containing protein [Saccharofermentans sp.]